MGFVEIFKLYRKMPLYQTIDYQNFNLLKLQKLKSIYKVNVTYLELLLLSRLNDFELPSLKAKMIDVADD